MNLKCDSCGKFISERDFDHGASRKLLEHDNAKGGEVWETICIKCNMKDE